MSKSDKLTNQGAVASRSRSAQKVLDSERRFIDDLFQVRLLTFEARPRVIKVMAEHGLKQGDDGLEIYAMCELPSNVTRADEFLRIFDGYSIGSNDLTQLVLGIDRDSGTVSHLFDENDRAVLSLIAEVIDEAQRARKPIGICGQAPSDFPGFARWLVEQGITSISLNPDTAIRTALVIADEEPEILKQRASAA